MPRFSANLGFLWTELSLPDAIHAASKAGFEAVECHWPYATPLAEVKAALAATGLPMLGLNTRRGDPAKGDNGLAAVVGRQSEARDCIDEAIIYAAAIDCPNVHVMAGNTDQGSEAEATFQDNLRYASTQADKHQVTILIEPLNHYDAPGYHLNTLDAALDTIKAVGTGNIKVMFDCYHLQIMQGDLTRRLQQHLAAIGHVQIAAVPDRDEPDRGELHYPNLLRALDAMGWQGYVGAEYRPANGTQAGLGWLQQYR
jgi:hydroxypyruvate isomerase